jgi:hypothetical protein
MTLDQTKRQESPSRVSTNSKEEPFGYGPAKAISLIHRTAAAETREARLEKALRMLLETHCCDTGEVDYRPEWLDENTTVCDACRPARALERKG